jgi:DNA mismatch repair protein MutS
MAKAKLTPMMQQYLRIKAQYQDVILFFQLGDFYETFFEDAELVARELDIALTKRDEAPMAGVPVKRVAFYVNQLLKKGYKVALCEQLQDPEEAKGLVERDVVRIITPGTILEEELLERGVNNYLVALYPQGDRCGLAYADISTGEFRATELELSEVTHELNRLRPAELILPQGTTLAEGYHAARSTLEPSSFQTEKLLEHFGIVSLDGLGLPELAGRSAAGLLSYVKETQKGALQHLGPPKFYQLSAQMGLDPFTVRNLELVEELRSSGTQATLFHVINQTVTAMGERLLRRWLLAPLLDRAEIERRLDAVEFFVDRPQERGELRELLGRISDLERLAGRLGAGRATPRDLLSLRQSLEHITTLTELMQRWEGAPPKLTELLQGIQSLALDELRELLRRAIREDAPLELKEGNIIQEGFSPELDELKAQERIFKRKILELEARERERTGIQTLKVGFNTVFGYYIEVSKAAAKRVPPDYHRKQTLANAERFFTPELKEYEEKILSAEERAKRSRVRALLRDPREGFAEDLRDSRAWAYRRGVGCVRRACGDGASLSLHAPALHRSRGDRHSRWASPYRRAPLARGRVRPQRPPDEPRRLSHRADRPQYERQERLYQTDRADQSSRSDGLVRAGKVCHAPHH